MSTDHPNRMSLLEVVTAALIATLGIMTAFSAFKGAQADGMQADNATLSQIYLNDSNTFFVEANQGYLYDLRVYDEYIIHSETDPELADYFYNNLSPLALESTEREEAFDAEYEAELYATAEEYLALSETLFDISSDAAELAEGFQLNVLFLAVGLSFAAWASLMRVTRVQWMFTILAGAALAVALVQLLPLLGWQAELTETLAGIELLP